MNIGRYEPYKVEQWCKAVGIPFIESALSWEAGNRDEVSWWDGGSFHENLRNSTGLAPQALRSIKLDEFNKENRLLYERCLPHYEHLKSFKL